MSQRSSSGLSPFHNRTSGKPNCNVWTTRTSGGDDNLEEKMQEAFCQTLSGHLGGYAYVTDPTPNTFTSNVPVKLNKDTYVHAKKVNLILYFMVCR